jgi:hypothetical protein
MSRPPVFTRMSRKIHDHPTLSQKSIFSFREGRTIHEQLSGEQAAELRVSQAVQTS